jgi:hypothetical protein
MRCVLLFNVFPCWKAAERAESLDADRECKFSAAIAEDGTDRSTIIRYKSARSEKGPS